VTPASPLASGLDDRTPVLVGGGQWSNRVDQGEPPVEPVDMMAEALRRASADSGTRTPHRLLADADAIRVSQSLSRRYPNPARLGAERVGASPRDEAVSPIGGNEPQALVAGACRDIAAGKAGIVLVCGAEAWRTVSSTGPAERQRLGWTRQDESVPPARPTAPDFDLNHPAEVARHVYAPSQVYALMEQALRHAAGRSIDEQLVHVSELWAEFNAVAVGNPHAWIREPMTAEQIRTPSPANRWVWWPYTKLMNANNAVEQAAAVIVCSAERASALGVPRDRWVFPVAATQSHDTAVISQRDDLRSAPALGLAARELFSLAGVGIDDVAHIDLYSCFPSAVQVAAAEIGLPIDRAGRPGRPLTVTGGLSFAGGPWNNYVSHALATMVGVLRANPDSLGLVTALGGYITKHALGLYATEPPAAGFRWADVQDQVDEQVPRREFAEAGEGAAVIESWVVEHDRDGGARRALAACLLDDGRRAWASSDDPDTVAELRSGTEQTGRAVKIGREGTLLL
jgi:acetyl-CoA C-acetyltransferase